MEEFLILILVAVIATNSFDKAESVQLEELEELPLQTFDELFVEEWWDKDEAEDLKTPAPTNFGQNVHRQIARQNTQIGQIEPNSIDPNENIAEDERKRKIIDKFHEMKEAFKQKGKYSSKEWTQIYNKIAKHLKVNHKKYMNGKKEFGLSRKNLKNEQKNLVEKFDQMKAELKRAGINNSYNHEIDETIAKELGLCFTTIYNWKRKLGQTIRNKYPHSEQKELMKRYYEIKDQKPKISDEKIATMLNIGRVTLFRWKKQFKPNSVDRHSVEVNAAANVPGN